MELSERDISQKLINEGIYLRTIDDMWVSKCVNYLTTLDDSTIRCGDTAYHWKILEYNKDRLEQISKTISLQHDVSADGTCLRFEFFSEEFHLKFIVRAKP